MVLKPPAVIPSQPSFVPNKQPKIVPNLTRYTRPILLFTAIQMAVSSCSVRLQGSGSVIYAWIAAAAAAADSAAAFSALAALSASRSACFFFSRSRKSLMSSLATDNLDRMPLYSVKSRETASCLTPTPLTNRSSAEGSLAPVISNSLGGKAMGKTRQYWM